MTVPSFVDTNVLLYAASKALEDFAVDEAAFHAGSGEDDGVALRPVVSRRFPQASHSLAP